MGLDGVELIIATEEMFSITIANEEAEKVITVDDLYQLILSKVRPADKGKCITASAFYTLRGIIAGHLNLGRRTISRKTRLDEVIPLDGRKAFWNAISKDTGLTLPNLTRNAPLNYALFLIPAASVLYAIAGIAADGISNFNAIIVAGIGIAATYALAAATEPIKIHFAQNTATMEALTRNVVANNFTKLSDEGREWNESDLYQSYIELISEQLGIEKAKIKKHHGFVDDLGVD